MTVCHACERTKPLLFALSVLFLFLSFNTVFGSMAEVLWTSSLAVAQGSDGRWRGSLKITLVNISDMTVHTTWMSVSLASVTFGDGTSETSDLYGNFSAKYTIGPHESFTLPDVTFTSFGFDKPPEAFDFIVKVFLVEVNAAISIDRISEIPIPEFGDGSIAIAVLALSLTILVASRTKARWPL